MFCRDKDFIPVSGSPGGIRDNATSIPEIAMRFHAGEVGLALFISYLFSYSDCIFFFFPLKTEVFVRLKCSSGSIQTVA